MPFFFEIHIERQRKRFAHRSINHFYLPKIAIAHIISHRHYLLNLCDMRYFTKVVNTVNLKLQIQTIKYEQI